MISFINSLKIAVVWKNIQVSGIKLQLLENKSVRGDNGAHGSCSAAVVCHSNGFLSTVNLTLVGVEIKAPNV